MNASNDSEADILEWIGRLTISWGMLEGALDHLNHEFARLMPEHTPRGERPKTSLRRKIRYARDTLSNMPIKNEDKKPLEDLFQIISNETQLRHDVVHSFLIEFGSTEFPDSAKLLKRIFFEDGSFKEKNRNITKKDIIGGAVVVQHAAAAFMQWAAGLAQIQSEQAKPTSLPPE